MEKTRKSRFEGVGLWMTTDDALVDIVLLKAEVSSLKVKNEMLEHQVIVLASAVVPLVIDHKNRCMGGSDGVMFQ